MTSKQEPASAAAKKARILVVDDERAIRELLHLHLQNEGHEVIEANDAVVAGRMLLDPAAKIDLLIVDAQMPYMTGIDFAAAVIADSTLPPVPIILITGHTDLATRADVLDIPCLTKPFSADALMSVVEKCIAATLQISAAGVRTRTASGSEQQRA